MEALGVSLVLVALYAAVMSILLTHTTESLKESQDTLRERIEKIEERFKGDV